MSNENKAPATNDIAISTVGLVESNVKKRDHSYLVSLKDTAKNKRLFLAVSNPNYDGMCIDVIGAYVSKETDVGSISKENLISIKFPLANVNSIRNLNFKAK